MPLSIRRAGVIGAGTMGAGIAAQLANAGIPTILLDIPGEGSDRNGPARKGLERALKGKPAAFMVPERASLIKLGNTEDDLALLGGVDWVVEAILEKLDVKRAMLERLEGVVGPNTIVSSNSSGIPMGLQIKGRSDDFRKRFLGTHFFNPPRYLHLLELIPTKDTDPHVLARMGNFGDQVLGKGIVLAKDVPGFAANRIGLYGVVRAVKAMVDLGLTPDVVDVLTGPLIGRPKSATFRTMDLSGLDICYQVAQDLNKVTGEDFAVPDWFGQLIERKWLGDKTGSGFFKKVKNPDGSSTILTLNLSNFEYEDRGKVRLEELGPILKLPTPEQRVKALLDVPGPIGEFTRRTQFELIHYAAGKVGEVADTANDVDNAMKWGFGWDIGPLEMAEALGHDATGVAFSKLGLDTIAIPQRNPDAAGPIVLRNRKQNHTVLSRPDACLIDLGDGVACLEFTSKANSIGAGVLEMFELAHAEVEKGFIGLVVGNQGENFCAGADLGMLLHLSSNAQWEEIDAAVKAFQGMTSKLRYCPYPVVSTPFRMNLGGGCEVGLWSDACQAGAELYTGLVEMGVGIIPGGGGTTEMLIRMNAKLQPGADPFSAVRAAFELIAMGRVSASALEAKSWGFLTDHDDITFNHDRLITEAKTRVLELAPGYTPPLRRQVTVLGEAAYANLCLAASMMHSAGQITEYEVHLARTLAKILSGGLMNRPDVVDEQVLLDLEREAILHLVGQEKTRERIGHTLKTGKTLRN